MRTVLDHRQTGVGRGEKTVKQTITVLMLTGLSLASGLASAADPLGRLFFTPDQRAQLDTARTQKSRATLASEVEVNAAPVAEILTLDGSVRRSDGKSTVWINNRAINDREASGGVVIQRLQPDGAILLQVPQSARSIDLKVGQSVDIVSGTIEEPFARQITATKPAAAESAAGKPAPGKPPAPVEKTGTNSITPEQTKALEQDLKTALERMRSTPTGEIVNAPSSR